jgi:hypothetical protein
MGSKRYRGLKFSNSNFGFGGRPPGLSALVAVRQDFRISDFFRPWWPSARTLGLRISVIPLCLLLLSSVPLFAQSKPSPMLPAPPIERAEGEKQARKLVSNFLAQRPTQNYTNTQVVRIKAKKKPQQEIPVRFLVVCTPTNYSNIYQVTGSAKGLSGTTLTIVHTPNQPNEYFLLEPGASVARRLTAAELNLPFAGSDFSVGDLGLEFLQWPQQRILRKDTRKELICNVLQSTNPNPLPGTYSHVDSWLDANQPDEMVLVHANAYDLNNDRVKEFDPKKLQKINGAYQLQEMEMRNLKTDSRTRIEFNLDKD